MKTPEIRFDLIGDIQMHRRKDETFSIRPNPGSSIALALGDLDSNPADAGRVLETIAASYGTVPFVTGNNESRDNIFLYHNLDPRVTELQMAKVAGWINARLGAQFGEPRLHYLEAAGPLVIEGFAFVGRNGFWDHAVDPRITVAEAVEAQRQLLETLFNPALPVDAAPGIREEAQRQADKTQLIRGQTGTAFRAVSAHEAASQMRRGLEHAEELRVEILALDARPDVHTIIAATHTVPMGAPLYRFRDRNGEEFRPHTNSITANTRLAELAALSPKFTTHAFSHQIAPVDQTFHRGDRRVRYVAHPCGPPGDGLHPRLEDYAPKQIVVHAATQPRAQAQVPGK